MSVPELIALLPLMLLAACPVALMLTIAFYRSHALSAAVCSIGLGISFVSLFIASGFAPVFVTDLILIDGYALFYMGLIIAAALLVSLMSFGCNMARPGLREEFYILVLLAALGASGMAASSHFASFFLSLETLSVSLYALIAFERKSVRGVEAGIKYLVLAGASSAFLLFGMALVYFQTGTMGFAGIAARAGGVDSLAMTAGLALIFAGAAFKLALVPFHMWTPDVYEGASSPVAALVATVSKGAVFALLLRFFILVDIYSYRPLFILFALIAVLSMFAGNLLALFQDNIKRLLAYSSIAHMGYLLVAMLSSGSLALTSAGYYLAAYFISMLGAFGSVTVLSGRENEREMIGEYRGLARTNPWLSGVFAGMLLSLAGIPLTAGFVGKFFLVASGIGSALWLLVIALAVNSAISIYYYLRIIAALYAPAPVEGA